MAAAAPGAEINVPQLIQMKKHLKTMRSQVKNCKDEIESKDDVAVRMLKSLNKGYVASTLDGQPPYLVLSKKETGASWTAERFRELFSQIKEEAQRTGNFPDPDDCATRAMQHLKPLKRRRLTVKVADKRPHQKDATALIQWEQQEDAAQETMN